MTKKCESLSGEHDFNQENGGELFFYLGLGQDYKINGSRLDVPV